MVTAKNLRYALSAHEVEALRDLLVLRSKKALRNHVPKKDALRADNYNAAAIRAATRVFLTISTGLKTWDFLSARLFSRGKPERPRRRISLLRSTNFRLALSITSILLLHRLLYRFFLRLRLRLLTEKSQQLRKRYPYLSYSLTSRLAPAVGASAAGFALAIYPADQLRITIAIYLGARSLEFLYKAFDQDGYFRSAPWWFGSWMLFPLTQGQLLHAFFLDRDCLPKVPVSHRKGDIVLIVFRSMAILY